MSAEPPDTCYRWSCNFVVAHAVLASGFITAPVAVLHLVHRPHSGRAIFFAVFAAFCTAISLVLCCRFYAELKRPPWPRWLSASGGQETTREVSHDVGHPEQQVTARVDMPAALAADAIPRSYEHRDGAADCPVCLGEVDKGETVRRLPACQHVFHRECIDLWLRAHATCPVCRSGVLPERPPEVVVNIEVGHAQPAPMVPARPRIMFSGQAGLGLWLGPGSGLS